MAATEPATSLERHDGAFLDALWSLLAKLSIGATGEGTDGRATLVRQLHFEYGFDGATNVEPAAARRRTGRRHVLTKSARCGHEMRVMSQAHFGGGRIAPKADRTPSGGTQPRKDGTARGF